MRIGGVRNKVKSVKTADKKFQNYKVSTEESELRDSLISITSNISFKRDKDNCKLEKLSKQADQIYFDSTEDVISLIDHQLSSLENLDEEMKKRELMKEELIKSVDEIKQKKELVEFPENYDDVVNRISEEVIQEQNLIKNGNFIRADPFKKANEESKVSEESKGDVEGFQRTGKIIDMVKKKLASTMYNFNDSVVEEDENCTVKDGKIMKKIQKVRKNDKKLAMLEKEEKVVKAMIAKEKEKSRKEEQEIKENSEILNRSITSASSTSSNRSKLFMTQKRNSAKKNVRNMKRKKNMKKKKSINGIKLRPMNGVQTERRPNSKHHSRIKSAKNFIEKNIENTYMSEHEKFLRSLTEDQKKRYESLKEEIEEIIENPDLLIENKIKQYYSVYGEYHEYQEKHGEIEEKEIEERKEKLMINSKSKNKIFSLKKIDDKRMDVEYKKMKKRVSKIDNELIKLNLRWNDPEENEKELKKREKIINQFLEKEKQDEKKMAEILAKIDMSEFKKLENLDNECEEILKKIKPEEAIISLENMKQEYEKSKQALETEFRESLKVQKYQEFKKEAKKAINEAREKLETPELKNFYQSEDQIDESFIENENRIKELKKSIEQVSQKIESESENLNKISQDVIQMKVQLKELPHRNPEKFDEEVEIELKKKHPELYDDSIDGEKLYIKFLHLIKREKD